MNKATEKFLEYFDSLPREQQLTLHTSIAKRVRSETYYLKVKAEELEMAYAIKAFKELAIPAPSPELFIQGNSSWVMYPFTCKDTRNKLMLYITFLKGGKKK